MRTGTFAVMGLIGLMASPALAWDVSSLWQPLRTPIEGWVVRIEDARARGELDLATSLLDDAEHEVGKKAALLRQRGLIELERGRSGVAFEHLREAADRDSASEARVEEAAVLVTLGRWPEAVEVLAQAFEERGSALRADKLLADPRFSPLVSFDPYKDLLRSVREDQSGPLGRLLVKFERIEESARTAQAVLSMVARWTGIVSRLAGVAGSSVLALLALGLLLTFAFNQLGLLRPPWTLFSGMLTASVFWHLGVRIVTADRSMGFSTIAMAMGVVVAPWALFIGGRYGLRAWRRRHRRDPFSPELLAETIDRIEAVAASGRRALAAPVTARAAELTALRDAERALQDWLAGRSSADLPVVLEEAEALVEER